MGREDVNDAVNGLRGAGGVQRRQHEVASLGGGDGGGNGFKVAHLADEDDVRILAQDVAQRGGEGAGIGADLALDDDAALVAMQELDRVLDGNDMASARAVDLINHRRQGG